MKCIINSSLINEVIAQQVEWQALVSSVVIQYGCHRRAPSDHRRTMLTLYHTRATTDECIVLSFHY